MEGSYSSLPFGDGYSFSGADGDAYHFAQLDKDYYGSADSGTDHAQFRQYSSTQGRWMSPDPYDGSYDLSNPQSFNRYSYALNNPLSMTDPTGLKPCDLGPDGNCGANFGGGGSDDGGSGDGDGGSGDGDGGGIDLEWLAHLFESLFGGGPSFHGSLHPRPAGTGNPDWANADGSFGETLGLPSDVNWSKINPGIAGALGLPDAGCEFGACGGGLGLEHGTASNNKPPITRYLEYLLLRPWSFGVLLPIGIPAGPAGNFSFDLKQGFACFGVGVGVGGRGVNGGPTWGDTKNSRAILSGWSVSVNVAGPAGAQIIHNPSGKLYGPTVGAPGASLAVTYSWCSGK